MPYKRHKPVSDEEMHRERYAGHYTICQYLRDIYHLTEDPEIRMKCRVGIAMTKAMNQKFQDYKHFFEWINSMSEEERIKWSNSAVKTASGGTVPTKA